MIPPEPKQCRDIRRVHPTLAKIVLDILWVLKADGYHPFVIETYRSPERIAWLRKYRPSAGAIINSKHSRVPAEAVDIGFTKNGKAVWDTSFPGWKRLAELAKMKGLTAGYYWKRRDMPHVEMRQ